MAKTGLFSSIYGGVNHATQGIYNVLFNKDGSYSPIKRMDIRLGELSDEDTSFFSKNYAGIPYWVVGVFLLGFAYTYSKGKTN